MYDPRDDAREDERDARCADSRLRHDAQVHRACRADLQRDVARMERDLRCRLNTAEFGKVAAHYDVAVADDGRAQYPDAQPNFERDDRSRFTVGVEITTDDYGAGAVRAKRVAGYSLHHLPSGSAIPLRLERSGRAPVRIDETPKHKALYRDWCDGKLPQPIPVSSRRRPRSSSCTRRRVSASSRSSRVRTRLLCAFLSVFLPPQAQTHGRHGTYRHAWGRHWH